jgi:DNA repair protein RecO
MQREKECPRNNGLIQHVLTEAVNAEVTRTLPSFYLRPNAISTLAVYTPMIVTTEAIVLRSRKQGETSKIATLYTLSAGKLNVIAKGARETKSKFGGALEMFAKSTVVFYKRDRHDALSLLSKAETLDSHSGILKSLGRIETATAIIELILNSMHDEEANEDLFFLLDSTLGAIAKSNEDLLPSVLFRFYIQFARLMGFELDAESKSGLSQQLQSILISLMNSSDIAATISERDRERLKSFFQSYFAEHLPGVNRRSMKSAKVFSSL